MLAHQWFSSQCKYEPICIHPSFLPPLCRQPHKQIPWTSWDGHPLFRDGLTIPCPSCLFSTNYNKKDIYKLVNSLVLLFISHLRTSKKLRCCKIKSELCPQHTQVLYKNAETYDSNLKLSSRCGDTSQEPFPSPCLSPSSPTSVTKHRPTSSSKRWINQHSQKTVLPRN